MSTVRISQLTNQHTMKRLLLLVAAIATAVAVINGVVTHRLIRDNRRLEHNQHALLNDIEFYKTQAGESAASVEVLELRIREFRELRAQDAEEIRSLGIRLRRAESYATTVSETMSAITMPLYSRYGRSASLCLRR